MAGFEHIGSSGACCCCLGDSSLRSLLQPFRNNGETEIYSDMIYKCYGIQMVTGNDGQKDLFLICDVCVTRLRNAYLFRLQMEIAYESFHKYLINRKFFNKETCNSDEQSLLSDHIENDCNSEHSDNYSTDVNDDEFGIQSQNKDFVDKIKFIDIKDVQNTFIDDCPKIKSENELSVVNVRRKTCSRNKTNRKIAKSTKLTSARHKNVRAILKPKSIPKIAVDPNEESNEIHIVAKPFKLNRNDVTCKICNETFPWNNTLRNHMSTHFPNHICHVCGKFCSSKSSLLSHVSSHLDKQIAQTCSICNKSYEGLRNLRLHMRVHSHYKHLYKCPQCPERFKSFFTKVKHLIDIHNDEPNKYKCKLCPKRFLMPGYLTRHVRKCHLQERTAECAECHQRFYSAYELKAHMPKHTGVKNFHCEVCTKSYARRKTLTEHMKIHNNVKNFVCIVCGRAFTQKCTLKGHMKVHDKSKESGQEINKT